MEIFLGTLAAIYTFRAAAAARHGHLSSMSFLFCFVLFNFLLARGFFITFAQLFCRKCHARRRLNMLSKGGSSTNSSSKAQLGPAQHSSSPIESITQPSLHYNHYLHFVVISVEYNLNIWCTLWRLALIKLFLHGILLNEAFHTGYTQWDDVAALLHTITVTWVWSFLSCWQNTRYARFTFTI